MKFMKILGFLALACSFAFLTTPEVKAQGLEMTIDAGCASPFFFGGRINKDCNGYNRDNWGSQNSGTAVYWPAPYDTYLISVCDAFGACVWLGPVGSGYPQSAMLTADKAVYDGYYPCAHPTVCYITP